MTTASCDMHHLRFGLSERLMGGSKGDVIPRYAPFAFWPIRTLDGRMGGSKGDVILRYAPFASWPIRTLGGRIKG